MNRERPTEEDMTTCAGCGKPDTECDSVCEAYYKLERQALENEQKGIYLPAYCWESDVWFCSRCGAHLFDPVSVLCDACERAAS